MASTLLELTRQKHEDVERLERLIVEDLRGEAKTHRDKLLQSHRVRGYLDAMQRNAAELADIYKDEDGARKQDIADLRGEDPMSTFYDKLKEVRAYYKKFPSEEITEGDGSAALRASAEPSVSFSGEEALGRYLDLTELHGVWINGGFAVAGAQTDYHSYVLGLADFTGVPRARRRSQAWIDYLGRLVAYLLSFYERMQPLADAAAQLSAADDEFSEAWEAGTVPGWEDRGEGGSAPPPTAELPALPSSSDSLQPLGLSTFDSAEEIEMLGVDRVKDALRALGLKVGGTPAQRAARLFATKGKRIEDLDVSLFAKGAAPAAALGSAARRRMIELSREAARLESRVARLLRLLGTVQADTAGRVEKRQAMTAEELEAERAEAEEEAVGLGEPAELELDSDEEAPIYNPLKLPLGWDGRPIPYWLYRLHGLNIEFKCEICGQASYWGRRAYERHFKEAQHQQGLRTLGIPWSKEFYEVTSIGDALALWKSIRERRKTQSTAEGDEEFEDEAGNVYSKKTWLDLQRQGLV